MDEGPNAETARRRAIARRNAAIYAANPNVRAIVLVGSTARDQCDPYSDIDMIVVYDQRPGVEELRADREHVGGEGWRILVGSEEAEFVDTTQIDGVDCQGDHTTLAEMEGYLADVLERYDTDHDKHTIMGGMLEGIPLHGEELVRGWQTRIASYPDELAQAMVRQHLQFRPGWFLEQRVGGRDTLIPFYQLLLADIRKMLGVLLGLNRAFPEHDFKRFDGLVRRLAIAPPDLDARIKAMLRSDYAEAVRLRGALLDDLLALVEQHMPEVDTAEVRAQLAAPAPMGRS